MGEPALPWAIRLLRLLLPAAYLERVVAPAYGDLSAELGRRPGPIATAGLVVAALWSGAPAIVWWRGRPTAIGGVVFTLTMMALLVAYLRTSGLYS